MWCLGTNRIFTALRHVEAQFSEDIDPRHLSKVMRGVDFFCIYHHLLLSFACLFLFSTHIASQEHHSPYPFMLHSMEL